MALVETIYRLTGKLPAAEQWGLTSQMRRAAVSVPSNIAEGYSRQSTGDYRHHLGMGRGSLLELETQVLLGQRLAYVPQEDMNAVLDEIQQISKMLGSLISKVR